MAAVWTVSVVILVFNSIFQDGGLRRDLTETDLVGPRRCGCIISEEEWQRFFSGEFSSASDFSWRVLSFSLSPSPPPPLSLSGGPTDGTFTPASHQHPNVHTRKHNGSQCSVNT